MRVYEIKDEIKKLCLEMAAINNGNVDLMDMFNENDEVNLLFSCQKNKGFISQCGHRNDGFIRQDKHTNNHYIWQGNHGNSMTIFQGNHTNNGDIEQNNHENKGGII